ncbi:MAG: NAD(P)-binding protein [Gemmatimonadetes bacterium]|nr:NAD(P)-binding protein [Gemmatimonadota bacterium]
MTFSSDHDLGMGRSIPRRDFVSGVGVALTGSLLPFGFADPFMPLLGGRQERIDPPARTGMRGTHDGSWETAHGLVRGEAWDRALDTGETYDLVVVGGGISGLSAAHFFRRQVGGPDARVLVLDNHDDFGGHAKRNEFRHDGRLYLVNGGTLNVEAPSQYSPVAAGLLWDLGIDRTRYWTGTEEVRRRYAELGLSRGYFFDREHFGEDRLVSGWGRRPWSELAARTPLSESARADLVRLYEERGLVDPWPRLGSDEKKARLTRMSYRDWLIDVLGVDSSVALMQDSSGHLFVTGADAVPAIYAWEMGYPGFAHLGLEATPPERLIDEPGGSHGRENAARAGSGDPTMYFPDGNATITRLLVRALIPEAMPGSSMEDVVLAPAAYDRLDRDDSAVRIRLSSTVVGVRHLGDTDSAREVEVTYVRDGTARRVRARGVVLACWNQIIPWLCPELSDTQKEALGYGEKAPLVYTNVFLRRWRSLVDAGVSGASAPGSFHQSLGLSTSLRMGAYTSGQNPDEPAVLRMSRYVYEAGHSRREQHRRGRRELQQTSFEAFERNIRDQLARMFGDHGFDPAEDVLAITVNRWPHGYTYSYNPLFEDPRWAFGTPDDRPCVVARQPFGRITIANADAAASPHSDAAINEAYRAVQELRGAMG